MDSTDGPAHRTDSTGPVDVVDLAAVSTTPTPSASLAEPGPTLAPTRRVTVDRLLAGLAGPGARLRADQERAVAALCEPAARVLVVQATGWGKSAVYWAATAVRREEGAGPTLVVSPLIALMRDQVAAAGRAGLTAATLNSGNVQEWSDVEARLRAGGLDVLLVSPERLANPGFGRRVLDGLSGRLGLLVVDEAHAVSDWGHDFRPDYRRVAEVLRRLNPDTPVLATTATANARVSADVATQLGDSTFVLRGPLARSSLQLAVLPEFDGLGRYAWVVAHLGAPGALSGSGIVYTLTVADAERLTEAIRAVHGDALPVAAYTGRTPVEERQHLEDALRRNELKALVATSALGMGYDKPDLGFVVHLGSPPSPVSYYQQIGRAGRAIDHAVVALLPSRADAGVWEHYATSTLPDERSARALLEALAESVGREPEEPQPASVPALEARSGLRRGRVELLLKQLAVDGAVDRVEGGWVASGRPWRYDRAHYDGIVAGRRREADIMRAYIAGEDCLMRLLQTALDDPEARPCGRCSVCLAALPPGLADHPDPAVADRIGRLLRCRVQVLEPRKMWPGGVSGRRGRIDRLQLADPGRVLVHADAPEWAATARACLDRDGDPTPELLEGAVQLMVGWSREWARRPDVVATLACGARPTMLAGVAGHVARVGRLDRIALAIPPTPDMRRQGTKGEDGATSAQEARHWIAALTVDDASARAVTGRCVLLVVDRTGSQWPITVAAAALRSAGADAVLPLLVHEQP